MAAVTSTQGRRLRTSTYQVKSVKRGQVDWVLVAAMALLTVLGLIMTYSTTFLWAYTADGSPLAKLARQVFSAVLGLAAFVVFSRLDYQILRRWSVPIMLVCLIVLAVVYFAGDVRFNARRTLMDGSVQPSEFAKICILVYAATWLASRRAQVQSIANGLVPFGVIIGIGAGLIALQPDLSTTGVIVLAAAAMFFVAGASLPQIILVFLVASAAFLLMVSWFPHATGRMDDFIKAIGNPPENAHWHIRQALIAFAEGGLFGEGWGASYQKYGLLPTPHTDSVFAVLAEEMGWFGVVATLSLFALLAYRAFRIARRADTAFGAFLAIGLISWIMAQTLVNIMAMTALLPLPGVPVPFLSLGGSSLVSVMAACGILVSISRGTRLEVSGEDAGDGGASGSGGGVGRASSTIRRRNSRSRVAGANRAENPEADDATEIIGRDVQFDARITRGSGAAGSGAGSGRAGVVRRGAGRYGARTGPARWR